ncbi:hypothetical protein HDC93_005573 [Streptomyces sp. AK010]|nr:hypothetical protein [Streptomyces sp. AK010]
MMYRILFRPDGLDAAYARRLVAGVLRGVQKRSRAVPASTPPARAQSVKGLTQRRHCSSGS